MGIVLFDAKGTASKYTSAPAGANVDFTALTVGSAQNRAMVAMACYEGNAGGAQAITATWDALGAGGPPQPMTLIGDALSSNGADNVRLFGLVAPRSGNFTLRFATTAGCSSDFYVDAISFSGVDQTGGTTTFRNFNTNEVASSSISLVVSSAAGEIVVAAVTAKEFFITSVNNTEIFIDNSAIHAQGAGNYASGAASVTMSAVFGGALTTSSIGGVSIKAALVAYTDLEEFTPPVLKSRIQGKRSLAIHHDASMFLPLIDAQVAARTLGWEIRPPQPPSLISYPRVRSGSTMRGNDGTQASLTRDLIPSGWEETPRDFQVPHPAPERRAGAVMRGDEGIQYRLDFLPKGWWIREVQPPHPRREKSGSIMPIEPGIEAVYPFFRPVFIEATLPVVKTRRLSMVDADFPALLVQPFISAAEWSMDATEFLIRPRRFSAIEIEPSYIPIVIPIAWGYEDANRAAHPRRRTKLAEPAQDRAPPFRLFSPWWDRVAPTFSRARRRPVAQTEITAFPFARPGFVLDNEYLLIQRKRRRLTDPYRYVEKHFFPPVVNGWEFQSPQPPHRRQRRAASHMRGLDGIELRILVPLVEGWQVYLVWPPHPRGEKGGSIMAGDVFGDAWARYVKLLVSGAVASDFPVWDAASWDRLA